MSNLNHSLHDQYAKPEDQCVTCEHEKIIQEQQEADINAQIDQSWMDSQHNHSGHRR